MFDVCVIGAGPGGYVAAIRARQLGLKVALIEKEFLGGVCLNVGCIPSKALISAGSFYHRIKTQASNMGFYVEKTSVDMKQLHRWKNSVCEKMSGGVLALLKSYKVEVIKGEAQFENSHELMIQKSNGEKQNLKSQNFILAIGSRPMEIPGFEINENQVLSSTGVLDLKKLPKKVITLGGGYIGLEMSSFLSHLGVEVEIVEANSQILLNLADLDCVKVIERSLKKQNVKIHLKTKALNYKVLGNEIEIQVENMQNKKKEVLKAEKIILTVGRKPNSDKMNLKSIGLDVDEKGFIKVDEQRRTSLTHIFAIGDVACQPMLAHKSSYEGIMVAEVLSGQNRAFDAKTIPSVIFTSPEIASCGLSEKQAYKKYSDLKVGKFSFGANGRAQSLMEASGFIKVLAEGSNNVIVGVHMVGPEVSQLISEAVLAIEMGATLEDIALCIHPHPTLSEVFMEACHHALGICVHSLN